MNVLWKFTRWFQHYIPFKVWLTTVHLQQHLAQAAEWVCAQKEWATEQQTNGSNNPTSKSQAIPWTSLHGQYAGSEGHPKALGDS